MNQRSTAAIAATLVLQFVLLWSVAAQAETLQPVAHPEELGFDVTRLERVTKSFQGYVDAGQLPGAVVLIARHDKVAYVQAFGYQDREAKVAMAPDSIFRIASMTKPIVSVGAMMLVEKGRLDLAAPVSQYLPGDGAGVWVHMQPAYDYVARGIATFPRSIPEPHKRQHLSSYAAAAARMTSLSLAVIGSPRASATV